MVAIFILVVIAVIAIAIFKHLRKILPDSFPYKNKEAKGYISNNYTYSLLDTVDHWSEMEVTAKFVNNVLFINGKAFPQVEFGGRLSIGGKPVWDYKYQGRYCIKCSEDFIHISTPLVRDSVQITFGKGYEIMRDAVIETKKSIAKLVSMSLEDAKKQQNSK